MMNAPERIVLPDVQSTADSRNVAIEAVGVKDVRYPFTLQAGEHLVHTIGAWTMTVGLPAHVKGTHMSRFIELLERLPATLDMRSFGMFGADMLERLGSTSGSIEVRFPYFIRKAAPISRVSSLLDYDVAWTLTLSSEVRPNLRVRVVIPATSLCPCSKEISAYGAHNQRSHITIDAEVIELVQIEDIINIAERSASCEVYGLLKRADEKHVTERAYENPKFVEDLVRDIALELDGDRRIGSYVLEAENFESIHNHSAYARVTRKLA
jgi:GTP cyclohydrolase IB